MHSSCRLIVFNMDVISYKLEVYDGPLDLLLALIMRNKINIYDIPIAEILSQYLAYMEKAAKMNIELSSEFVVMACELLVIKSKMLLPVEPSEKDPREELVAALLEYSKVKQAAEFLNRRKDSYFERFESRPMPLQVTKVLKIYSATELSEAMENVRITAPQAKRDNNLKTIGQMMTHKVIPVEEKIIFVLRRLCDRKNINQSLYFKNLFQDVKSKSEVVAIFLATLELTKSGRIKIERQAEDYKIILIREKVHE